ncbi:MAG: glycosyl transferase [Lysobacteraceae bacterium]|nr:MAG: glycosyl transferase [Xanthomonadaceae bacterium]
MSGSLRVLQLLPALESGGVEQSTLEIAEALVEAGHRSFVASAGGRLVEPLLATGSTHVDLDLGRKSPWTLRHIAGLRRLIEQLEPDIVHARSRLPAWIAWWALSGLRGPRPHFVTTVHGLNSPGHYSSIMTRGERVICVSETVREHVLQHYPGTPVERLVVIPRGIDPHRFRHGYLPDEGWRRAFEAAFPQLAGGLLLTLPGRGTRLKGHAEAISLLARLRAAGLDARLLLLGAEEAGRSHYLDALREQARLSGVADVVAISPPRDDVRDIMAVSALVLQLSTKPEAFGRTVLEALSLGRPVLGFDHGGVGEQLRAWFPQGAVPPGDAKLLAVRAIELLRFPPRLAPIAGPTRAQMQASTLALYRELAATGLIGAGHG